MASSTQKSKQSRLSNRPKQNGELTSNRTVLLVLGLFVAVFFVFSYLERVNELIAVRSEIVSLQDNLDQAEQRNAELEAALREVAEPAYVGETARAELGLIQPGDDPFVILGQEPPSVETESPADLTANRSKPNRAGMDIFNADWWRSLFGLQ